jgi:RecA-family ATPase
MTTLREILEHKPTASRYRELLRQVYQDSLTTGDFRFADDQQRNDASREITFYRNGRGYVADWQTYERNRRELNALAKAETDKAKAEIDAVNQAKAKFEEERLAAKIAQDLDPVTQYRRAHAERTF